MKVSDRTQGAILVLCCAALMLSCEPEERIEPAAVAPDFTSAALDDEAFTLSEYRGEVVLLNFWATWCAPCVVEVPHLVRLQDELGERGLVVAGVSQDRGPDAEREIRDFAERLNVNYPLLLDADFSVASLYEVLQLPTTIVIDREGNIHDRKVGLLSWNDLVDMVGDLIDLEE